MPLKVSIADYGVGNLRSLRHALLGCGADAEIVSDMEMIADAECIAFPGVGAFDRTMERLLPHREEIRRALESGTPCLGVCIGAQILMEGSDEGSSPGLGVLEGRAVRMEAERLPHMGWNTVEGDDPLLDGISDRRFYFAHSYRCAPSDPSAVRATAEYGGSRFPALLRRWNTVGTQFHPEKSSGSGTRLLSSFIEFAEGCL